MGVEMWERKKEPKSCDLLHKGVICKVPQFGGRVLDPSFAKINEIKKSGWKPYTREKKRWPNWFSHPYMSFTFKYAFALPPAPSLLLLISFSQSSLVVTILSCKSCELLPSFVWWYPVSLTFHLHSNQGWNRDLMVKLGLKHRVTSRMTLIAAMLTCMFLKKYSFQSWVLDLNSNFFELYKARFGLPVSTGRWMLAM